MRAGINAHSDTIRLRILSRRSFNSGCSIFYCYYCMNATKIINSIEENNVNLKIALRVLSQEASEQQTTNTNTTKRKSL